MAIDTQHRLQRCTPKELDELVNISKRTFVDAFEKQNNPKDFKRYVDFAFSKKKIREELANKNSIFYFAFADSDLAGYFKLNENDAQTDIKVPEAIELERFYVLEEFQGKHIGEWMLNKAKKMASDMQKEFLWLGVWENNVNAIGFYQKYGFLKFGTHPYYVGKDEQTDWLMRFDIETHNRI